MLNEDEKARIVGWVLAVSLSFIGGLASSVWDTMKGKPSSIFKSIIMGLFVGICAYASIEHLDHYVTGQKVALVGVSAFFFQLIIEGMEKLIRNAPDYITNRFFRKK